ncbi:uncharacterized protein ARMOST_17653 [Armillaria ostoyae]|uniref:Peptidase C14 caspase domain-containing protein n=1 Tax=Armillaria ostoyae TaxID=47428 RepID=A0A284RZK9_ARMOS|nr:uncharacterized protein ARMOST_17653 [Armillaria ostoyae]
MISSDTDKTLPVVHAQHGKVDGQKFWAVVIGIDGYKTSPLRGCISDAEMVAEYLKTDLHIPENHIQLLLSTDSKEFTESVNKPVSSCCDFAVELTDERISKPIRANIIEAILGLSTNTGIQHGENILIYFAGHGTTYECANYLQYKNGAKPAAALGTIEALCPIDRGPKPTTTGSTNPPDTNDANSSVTSDPQVPDISDWEINTILAEIARTKGNHITFILDCCHSFSITRGPQEGVRVRAIMPLPSSSITAMFSAADQKFEHLAGYQSISEASWRAKMDSHVVLAACKEFEYAKEGTVEGDSRFNGAFTQALISAFKSADKLNDKSMTYYKLMLMAASSMPTNAAQHPVIAGEQKELRLWFQDDDSSNSNVSSD